MSGLCPQVTALVADVSAREGREAVLEAAAAGHRERLEALGAAVAGLRGQAVLEETAAERLEQEARTGRLEGRLAELQEELDRKCERFEAKEDYCGDLEDELALVTAELASRAEAEAALARAGRAEADAAADAARSVSLVANLELKVTAAEGSTNALSGQRGGGARCGGGGGGGPGGAAGGRRGAAADSRGPDERPGGGGRRERVGS